MADWLWYFYLLLIGMGLAGYAMYKTRNTYRLSTLSVFYLFASSVTWIGEFIVLGLFDSYKYKPGLTTDPWAENLTGHLFLNATLWPGAALILVCFSLGYGSILFISGGFVATEYLFIRLGIYEHHWWRYYMTALSLILFLIIAKKWFQRLIPIRRNALRLLTLYFAAFVVIHIPFPFLLLLQKQYYRFSPLQLLVGNRYRSSIMFAFTYHLFECLILILFICVLDGWYWKLAAFAISIAGQVLLYLSKVLILQNQWHLTYTCLIYVIGVFLVIWLERHTLLPERGS